jgi:hypothetical protein
MECLRQTQQQYEQELISKGIIPYPTEEAIKQYAEQQRTQIITDKIDTNKSNRVNERIILIYSNKNPFLFQKNCLMDYISSNNFSNKKSDNNLLNKSEELEAFESDNVHPCLYEIFNNYKFQTNSGKEMGEKFEDNLHKTQIQIKTIFPKINQQDLIRQELEAIKVY